ncbi:N-acetyl-gamma-glutamyl-phosphate reductase [Nitrospira sp. Kam-Ns4a]
MGTSTGPLRVAVVGASGYVGGELLRLLAGHPRLVVSAVTSEKSAGVAVSALFPHLAGAIPQAFEALVPEAVAERSDAVFLALPHTKSLAPVAACRAAGKPVVDLSADYRLKDPVAYEAWYGTPHPYPELLTEAVYGLPELHRAEIKQAKLVSSPGCYPTAAILQLAPLLAQGLIEPDTIVIDAKSGISGAGRSPALPYHFPEAHEAMEAYKIGRHRHVPEIEQELTAVAEQPAASAGRAGAVRVVFTPHLVPLNRGLLSTAYGRLRRPLESAELRELYRDFYQGERFIRIMDSETAANPRHVRGSNYCDLSVHADARTGWIVTVAALDNLVKGAAGQAIQAMNLMLGLPEESGLTLPGLYP